jgi:hypothetical protein
MTLNKYYCILHQLYFIVYLNDVIYFAKLSIILIKFEML